MDDPSLGIKATVIDLGLSRMDAGVGQQGVTVHWTPLDPEIFEGEGDYQFDVYRMMKAAVGEDWQAFKPLTNVMVNLLLFSESVSIDSFGWTHIVVALLVDEAH
jgi:serine/threonine-protein kinase haspin